MIRRIAATGALLAALALPAGAGAQSPNPFTPLPPHATPPPTAPATPTTATTSTSGSSGVSTGTIYAALGGAVLVLLAIGWFIARDARKVAPVPQRPAGAAPGHNPDRLRRQRAKAKAARRQRKRNR